MTDTLKHYRDEIKSIKFIDKESLIVLLRKARAGNKAARDKIIRSYLKLVVSFSKHYHGRHVSQLDLISHGNMGLFDAIDKFDFSRGTSFTTFAAVRIRKNMSKCLRDEDNTMRIPYGVHDLMSQEKKGKPLTEKQKDVVDCAKLARQGCSLNCCTEDNDELISFIPGAIINTRSIDLKLLQEELSSRERKVINLRLKNISLEKISLKMGVSRERIRQIEINAIKKMRKKNGTILDNSKA